MIPGMSNGVTYVGMAKVSLEESEELGRLELLSQKKDPDVEDVVKYMRTARELTAKHKDMFLAAGFREERGDKAVMCGMTFTHDIQFGYIPGIWELPETKPVLHLQPMEDGK